MPINIGQLAATTLQNYRKTMVDNISKDTVVYNHMKANGMAPTEPGGREMIVPLMYGLSTAVGTYKGTSTTANPYQEGIDAAKFDWSNYYVGISITKEDELKNSGEYAVKKLIKTKIKQAEVSLKERIADDIFTGAGYSSAGEIEGLQTLVAASGTVGAINGSTETFWRSYVEATGGALTVAYVRDMVNDIDSLPGGSVSLLPTTVALHGKFESLLTATLQYNTTTTKEMKRLGDAGFATVGFRGIPVVYDRFVPSGEMYALTDAVKLVHHKDANFDVLPMEKVSGQMVYEQYILATLSQTVDARRKLGKLTGKTA